MTKTALDVSSEWRKMYVRMYTTDGNELCVGIRMFVIPLPILPLSTSLEREEKYAYYTQTLLFHLPSST